ncbi:MAG: type II secretion system protein GspH [Burkholderiales bacterium]|nr:MAG: type II secretion system protein GspH [Burkholderiales bacterium]
MLCLRRRAAVPPAARRERSLWPGRASGTRGMTLLELLVVLSIAALATAGATLALRDPGATQLEREALRLSALLDAARAQSRTTGVAVRWQPGPQGFEFQGLRPPPEGMPANGLQSAGRQWLDSQTRAVIVQPPGASTLVLGPEPLIPAQRVDLFLGERRLGLASDGLGPFRVVTGEPGP